jgi:hypothetical protein
MWAGVVLAQPRFHAFEVEPVRARQHGHSPAQLDLIHANRTFRFPTFTLILLRDDLLRQRLNRLLACRTRRIARLMLLHQLRHDAIQRFLSVDRITCDASWWRAKELEDVCEGSQHAWRTTHHEGTIKAVVIVVEMRMRVMWMRVWATRHGANIHHHVAQHIINVLRLILEGLGGVRVSGSKRATEVGVGGCCDGVGPTRTSSSADEGVPSIRSRLI